jgi:hypothetical protein
VGEHLVSEDGGVVVDEDVFDGEGRNLGKEDAPEGIGDGGVEMDEGEDGVVTLVLVEFDVEFLTAFSEWPISTSKEVIPS